MCPSCLRRKCPYLAIDFGRTNLNQKEEKEIYTCKLGVFPTTRNKQVMPLTCKTRRLRYAYIKKTKKESNHDNWLSGVQV